MAAGERIEGTPAEQDFLRSQQKAFAKCPRRGIGTVHSVAILGVSALQLCNPGHADADPRPPRCLESPPPQGQQAALPRSLRRADAAALPSWSGPPALLWCH